MLHSLRGQLTPRKRAEPPPAPLLDLGSLPGQLPVARQERLAQEAAGEGVTR
jgi:hypothetical protein